MTPLSDMKPSPVTALTRSVPVIAAFGLAFLLFAATGFDAGGIVTGIVEGVLTGPGALSNTIRWTVPLVLIGLGIAASLRGGEFNIGAQGQMLVGSLTAVWVALEWSGPVPVVILVGTLLAVAAGAVWSAVAGVLKVYLGADEVIVTLMLNFIALQIIHWAATGPLKDLATSGDSASTPRIDPALRVQKSGEISIEVLILTALVVIAVWALLERSELGLQIRYAGTNPDAARWQGMAMNRIRISTYLIAGTLAGLAGAVEVFGPAGRVVTGSTPTLGFSALVVATVGAFGISGTVAAAVFFGGLQAAILYLPIVSDLPTSGLRIIEGLVAMLITAQLASMIRRQRRREPGQQELGPSANANPDQALHPQDSGSAQEPDDRHPANADRHTETQN